MNKIKGAISFRTLALLAAAMLLCLIGLAGAMGTRAALVYESEQYEARIAQTHLGVALLEQTGDEASPVVVNVGTEGVAYIGDADASVKGNLLRTTSVEEEVTTGEGEDQKTETVTTEKAVFLGDDKQMIPGKAYSEKLFAQNASTDMGQYVRLTIRKYWADEEGNKLYNMDPSLIVLEEAGGNWVKSESESDDEKLVFYYAPVLGAGQTTTEAIKSIKLDSKITEMKDQLAESGAKYHMCLSADVDAVQTKHAADAAKSAWGVDVDALGLNWNGKEA